MFFFFFSQNENWHWHIIVILVQTAVIVITIIFCFFLYQLETMSPLGSTLHIQWIIQILCIWQTSIDKGVWVFRFFFSMSICLSMCLSECASLHLFTIKLNHIDVNLSEGLELSGLSIRVWIKIASLLDMRQVFFLSLPVISLPFCFVVKKCIGNICQN